MVYAFHSKKGYALLMRTKRKLIEVFPSTSLNRYIMMGEKVDGDIPSHLSVSIRWGKEGK